MPVSSEKVGSVHVAVVEAFPGSEVKVKVDGQLSATGMSSPRKKKIPQFIND